MKALAGLEKLTLVRTRAGAESLAAIGQLKNLRVLVLDYTQTDVKGFAQLAGLTLLEELSLDSANVSDESVPVIAGMKKLRALNLYHTMVTEAGLEKLKAALPECRIEWEKDSTAPSRRRI